MAAFSPDSPDEILVDGCLRGDRLAQEYLYQKHYGRMMGIAMRYTSNPDEACDILNQAFLKVFGGLSEHYEGQGNLAGWIARIVFNTAIDHVRKQEVYRRTFDLNATPLEPPIRNSGFETLKVEDLYRLIQSLPTATRTVFSLYALDGFKHGEIATRLGISEGTSKWHLSEARKALQQKLANQQRSEERQKG